MRRTPHHSRWVRFADACSTIADGIASLAIACSIVGYVLVLIVMASAGCGVDGPSSTSTSSSSSSSDDSSSSSAEPACVGELGCECIDAPCTAPDLFCGLASACTHDCAVDDDCDAGLCVTGVCLVACEALGDHCDELGMPGASCGLVLGELVCQFGGAP